MTDTLKPAELDLEALKKVALEAGPYPWIVSGDDGEAVCVPSFPGEGNVVCLDPERVMEASRAEWPKRRDHIATFDPPTVLSLLTRIEALEAERDEALVSAGLAARDLQYAEAQRDRMREALEPFAAAAENIDDHEPDHGSAWESSAAMSVTLGDFRRAAALSQGSGEEG